MGWQTHAVLAPLVHVLDDLLLERTRRHLLVDEANGEVWGVLPAQSRVCGKGSGLRHGWIWHVGRPQLTERIIAAHTGALVLAVGVALILCAASRRSVGDAVCDVSTACPTAD